MRSEDTPVMMSSGEMTDDVSRHTPAIVLNQQSALALAVEQDVRVKSTYRRRTRRADRSDVHVTIELVNRFDDCMRQVFIERKAHPHACVGSAVSCAACWRPCSCRISRSLRMR